MIFSEYEFYHTDEYKKLKLLYTNNDNDNNDLHAKFSILEGDITKGIKWIWADNKYTLSYFSNFLESINIYEKIKHFTMSTEEFKIRGASFIVLNQSEVINSDFHYDTISQYDNHYTNIITLIFPLYTLEKDMGGLEYKINDSETKIYDYDVNKIIMWDSCKFVHRTQPYKLNYPKKRVLVSVNLSTNEKWAVNTVNKCLKYQGNNLKV